jgi:hypothetical protein
VFVSTENVEHVPEIVIFTAQSQNEGLNLFRIIQIPDFKFIKCLLCLEDPNLLLVGCHKNLVIFKQKGERYYVTKIVVDIFEGSLLG